MYETLQRLKRSCTHIYVISIVAAPDPAYVSNIFFVSNLPIDFFPHFPVQWKVGRALAFLSPFTWTSGENYLAVIARNGGPEVVDEYAKPIMEGYKKILLCLGGTQLGYVTAAYISCDLEEKKKLEGRGFVQKKGSDFLGIHCFKQTDSQSLQMMGCFYRCFFLEFKLQLEFFVTPKNPMIFRDTTKGGVFGFLALTFGYLGLRCSHRGKQA